MMELGAPFSMDIAPIHTENLILVPESRASTEARIAHLPPETRAHFSPHWLSLLSNSASVDHWVHGFSMQHRLTGKTIGSCGFKGPPDSSGMVEIAYGVEPEHQCKGYATEAAKALTSFAFNDSQVTLVRAHTLPGPNASTRVLTKSGFHFLGNVIDPDDGPVWRWEFRKLEKS